MSRIMQLLIFTALISALPKNHALRAYKDYDYGGKGAYVVRLPEALVQIAEVIKKTLIHKSTNDVTKMMKDHLIIMKLINEKNIWANKKLSSIGGKLLPGNLDGLDLSNLVDDMVHNAAKNPYLVDFLSQPRGAKYYKFKRLVALQGNRILPDVAAFAMVLERLTSSQREDWRVMQACQEVWDKEVKIADILSVTSPFEGIKTLSVDVVINKGLNFLEKGNVDPNFFRIGLPANILEAMAEDIRNGFLANGKVALTLAKNKPGGRVDSISGSGPARISEDGQAIEVHVPLKKQWADLYQTWNMAFVSHFPRFPYFLAKLLIPSVSNYQNAPELYIHTRALALHNFINWNLLTKIHGSGKFPNMNWDTREVTQSWGEQNYKSSQDYESRLNGLRPSSDFFTQVLNVADTFLNILF